MHIEETSLSAESIRYDSMLAKFKSLKYSSGTHSPSISILSKNFPELSSDIIDFCFLSNPYASDLFLNQLKEDIKQDSVLEKLIAHYLSQNTQIANYIGCAIGCDPNKIFVGNGAIEAIQAVIQNFCGKSMVIPLPTFSSYYEFVPNKFNTIFYIKNKLDHFLLNKGHFVDFVKKSAADSVVLINPNNPDGSYIPFGDLEMIVDELSYLSCIIIDESFIHFAYEDESLLPIMHQSLVDKYPNVVVIKSMSKDFGVAGVRAGYAIMTADRVKQLIGNGYLWNSNQFSEYFFELFSRAEFRSTYEVVRKKYIGDIRCFYQELQKIKNIVVYPSMANFILIELKTISAEELTLKLFVQYAVYVRNCNDKKGLSGEFIRLAVGKETQNNYLIRAINKLVNG